MEDVTVLLLILAFILFLTRYVRKRESLDFISMITSLLSLIAVIMDETLTDNEDRTMCGVQVKTLVTPGHTAGSSCFLVRDNSGEEVLFTGDTLFAGSMGRTDFPTGDLSKIRASLRRLAALTGDMPVYAGHNEPTTLDIERRTNPFVLDA